jgi:hypothetical protein
VNVNVPQTMDSVLHDCGVLNQQSLLQTEVCLRSNVYLDIGFRRCSYIKLWPRKPKDRNLIQILVVSGS